MLSLAWPRPWLCLDLYLAVRSLTGKMDSSLDSVCCFCCASSFHQLKRERLVPMQLHEVRGCRPVEMWWMDQRLLLRKVDQYNSNRRSSQLAESLLELMTAAKNRRYKNCNTDGAKTVVRYQNFHLALLVWNCGSIFQYPSRLMHVLDNVWYQWM